jgi:hypothetical protein
VIRDTAGSYVLRVDRLFGSFSLDEEAPAPSEPAPAPTTPTVVRPEVMPPVALTNWWLIGSVVAVLGIVGATAWFLARKRLTDIFRLSFFTVRMAILKLCASAKQMGNCLKILLGNIRRR